MSLSTAAVNALEACLHGRGTAEELVTAVNNGIVSTTNIASLGAPLTTTASEVNVLHGVVAGTLTNSDAVVVGAAGQLNTLAVTNLVIGTTTAPGAASQSISLINKKTGIVDTVATSIFTVTCPNGNHTAVVSLTLLAAVNNAGALDSARCAIGSVVFDRVTGANLVGSVSVLTGAAIATAGSATLTLAYGVAAVVGAVGAVNTMDIQVTLTKTGGTNHQIVVLAAILNSEPAGMTIASD